MNKTALKIITTSDGSHSLYNEELKETYHSTYGAVTESQHVFIKEGLKYLTEKGIKEFNVLEVGFGTGLNAFLTYDFAQKNQELLISYTTLEPFPLAEEIYSDLNYQMQMESELPRKEFLKLHELGYDEVFRLRDNFLFSKHKKNLQDFRSEQSFNLVFYDAFAPNKQSEMWELPVLEHLAGLMRSESVLTTYCAQGQFKRNLVELGMEIQSIEGPPGKKEMTRAFK